MPTKIKYEPALEAVFAATNTEKILKTLEDRVNSIDDIGALDELRQQFSIESEIFNKIIGNMLEAGERYKSNQITLEELAQIVKPYNEELKKKVTMLDLQEAEGSDYKLEDEEIAQLRAVLMGATEIIGQRRAAIQGPSGDEETAPFEGTDEEFEAAESFISSLKNFMIPTTKKNGLGNLKAAVEAFSGRVLRSSEAKTAKTTMKEAKAALRRKDLKNATALYKRAKSEWNTVLKAIDKLIVDKTGKAPAGSKIKEESMEKIKRKITHCDEMLAKIKELAEKIKNGTVKKTASESSIGVSALLDLISPALESDDGDDDDDDKDDDSDDDDDESTDDSESDDGDDDDDDKDDDSDDDDEPAEESLTNIINEFNNHRKFKK